MSKLKRILLAEGVMVEPIHLSHPLPDDLIIEILLRLPVPSILRFSSVSREWCSIIRSQRFIEDHTRFHQDDAMSLIVFWSRFRTRGYDKNSYGYSRFHDGAKRDCWNMSWNVSAVCGPCNGILCLLHAVSKRMVFWNPTTRMMRQVRECPIRIANAYDFGFGFGIDPLSGGLKIVVINRDQTSTSSHEIAFAVYNSRYDLWRLINKDESVYDHGSCLRPNLHGSVFSNGFCYWVKRTLKFKYSLTEFDTRTDSFQEIEMPKIPSRCDEVTLDLYNGVLALLTYRGHNDERCVDIWLMKEREEWTKLPTVFMPFEILSPIGICESNKIFAMKWPNRSGLIVYDPVSGDTRDLGFERENDHRYQVIPCPYKESLARL